MSVEYSFKKFGLEKKIFFGFKSSRLRGESG